MWIIGILIKCAVAAGVIHAPSIVPDPTTGGTITSKR